MITVLTRYNNMIATKWCTKNWLGT